MPSHVAPYQPRSEGVLVPEPVVKCGLVETEGRLFWGVDTREEMVYVSQYPERFRSDDRFMLVGVSTVGSQRFTRPPKQLYSDRTDEGVGEGDLQLPVFDASEPVEFEITPWLLQRDLCRVTPAK